MGSNRGAAAWAQERLTAGGAERFKGGGAAGVFPRLGSFEIWAFGPGSRGAPVCVHSKVSTKRFPSTAAVLKRLEDLMEPGGDDRLRLAQMGLSGAEMKCDLCGKGPIAFGRCSWCNSDSLQVRQAAHHRPPPRVKRDAQSPCSASDPFELERALRGAVGGGGEGSEASRGGAGPKRRVVFGEVDEGKIGANQVDQGKSQVLGDKEDNDNGSRKMLITDPTPTIDD